MYIIFLWILSAIILIWYIEYQHNSCKYNENFGGIPIEKSEILHMMPEWQPNMEYKPISILPDGVKKPYKFISGLYGDVPLNIYDTQDLIYKPEWDHSKAIYIPNMRTTFKQVYTPIEASYWH